MTPLDEPGTGKGPVLGHTPQGHREPEPSGRLASEGHPSGQTDNFASLFSDEDFRAMSTELAGYLIEDVVGNNLVCHDAFKAARFSPHTFGSFLIVELEKLLKAPSDIAFYNEAYQRLLKQKNTPPKTEKDETPPAAVKDIAKLALQLALIIKPPFPAGANAPPRSLRTVLEKLRSQITPADVAIFLSIKINSVLENNV